MKEHPVRVGLLGLGTVGAGTVNVLTRNAADIARRAGRSIVITHAAVNSLDKVRHCDTSTLSLTTQPQTIIDDPNIDIIVEVMGGTTRACEFVLRAIQHGKPVITANKALIATHGNEIFAAAEKQGVTVAFEAAVAGGIPIIKIMRESLAGNRVAVLAGIINGTSNFILSEMTEHGKEFAQALSQAQCLGYAESDPSFDIDGIDAAHKLTILASIAFGIPLQLTKTYHESIKTLCSKDFLYADQLGYRIKQLGMAKLTAQGLELRVHPTFISKKRLLAHVDGVMNAIWLQTDAVGPSLYYGAGAGAEPTASSIVADLVDVVRTLHAAPEHRVPYLAYRTESLVNLPILAINEIESAFYLRMQLADEAGILADVARILGQAQVSIESILQKEPAAENHTTVVIVTHRVKEFLMRQAIAEIEKLATIKGKVTVIRIEHIP